MREQLIPSLDENKKEEENVSSRTRNGSWRSRISMVARRAVACEQSLSYKPSQVLRGSLKAEGVLETVWLKTGNDDCSELVSSKYEYDHPRSHATVPHGLTAKEKQS
jgi:hypothetical protein